MRKRASRKGRVLKSLRQSQAPWPYRPTASFAPPTQRLSGLRWRRCRLGPQNVAEKHSYDHCQGVGAMCTCALSLDVAAYHKSAISDVRVVNKPAALGEQSLRWGC